MQLSEEFRWGPHVMLSSTIRDTSVWGILARACKNGLESMHVLPARSGLIGCWLLTLDNTLCWVLIKHVIVVIKR